MKKALLGLTILLAGMAASVAQAQMVGMPLVSTSVGGVVSGTHGYFRYISATSLAVTGAWCGLRQVTGFCVNASTPNYNGVNIACNGSAITAICTYNSDVAGYAHTGANCPAGYSTVMMNNYINGTGGYGFSCVKN